MPFFVRDDVCHISHIIFSTLNSIHNFFHSYSRLKGRFFTLLNFSPPLIFSEVHLFQYFIYLEPPYITRVLLPNVLYLIPCDHVNDVLMFRENIRNGSTCYWTHVSPIARWLLSIRVSIRHRCDTIDLKNQKRCREDLLFFVTVRGTWPLTCDQHGESQIFISFFLLINEFLIYYCNVDWDR